YHARQVGSTAGTGNDYAITGSGGLFGEAGKLLGGAMGGDDFGVILHTHLLQDFHSALHGGPVTAGAHHNGVFISHSARSGSKKARISPHHEDYPQGKLYPQHDRLVS